MFKILLKPVFPGGEGGVASVQQVDEDGGEGVQRHMLRLLYKQCSDYYKHVYHALQIREHFMCIRIRHFIQNSIQVPRHSAKKYINISVMLL
jgi:hypothetical protein